MKKLDEGEQNGNVMQFFMGLNDSYPASCGQILLMQPIPVVSRVWELAQKKS